MEEEFYVETGNKKKYILLTITIVVIIAVCLFLYKKYIFNAKTKVVFEVGDKMTYELSDYVNNTILDKDKYKLIVDDHLKVEDGIITSAGNYTFTIKYNGKSTKVDVEVKDTKAPDVEVQDLTVGLNEEFDTDEFVSVCNEYSKPCVVSYKNESDVDLYKKEGTHKVTIIIKDLYDNSVTKNVTLTVKKGYSLDEEKKKNLEPYRLSHDYGDWDRKTYVVKYVTAFDQSDVKNNNKYTYLYDMADDELSNYLPLGYEGSTIVDGEIIYVYNKYNYVTGFLYRATLSNDKVVYLTNGE